MKKISILIFSAILILAACDKTYHAVCPPDELGTYEQEFHVSEQGGGVDIKVLTNKLVHVIFSENEASSWAKPDAMQFDKDITLHVDILKNEGIRRRADLLLKSDTRCDTVSIYQTGGKEELFYIPAGSMVVYNGNAEPNTVDVDINVPLSTITTELLFPSKDEWIKDCKLTENSFSFRTDDNTDPDYTRSATILLSHINGWKQTETARIKVIQARADNYIGVKFTAEKLHEVATVDGYTLPDDALIEGLVVSDTENGNTGEIAVEDYLLGTGTIDYTPNDLTTYIEGLDGKNGFRLIAAEKSQNDFNIYEQVCLNAGGAVITKTATEPVCYTVTGVKSDNILTRSDASHRIPVKEMAIEDLRDDDIYTLVKIKNCEIPMRKGPFTPVNEGYTSQCNYHRFAKYPTLIRDIKGGSMYMFTNMTCPYRRTGERLPYGSGDITGIIVHEVYKAFEKDGDIGRYQIRHLRREDIDLKMDFKDNFSGLITEFRYALLPGEFDHTELPNAILATEGNGEMCHTYGAVGNFSPSYFYIGTSGSKYKNKYAEGAGIEFEDGTIYEPWIGKEDEQNTDGKGWFKDALKISWSNKYWWDSGNSRGYCWLVKFSTVGITSDRVSMQFAMYNNSQSARSPRYWKAQYSLTTTDTSASSDSQWTDIGEFSVPDVAIWGSQNDWQTVGTRVYDFPLPTSILGKEMVCIRLMPRNNKAAAKSVDSYDSSTIANNSGYNTMDYFAVRYNK